MVVSPYIFYTCTGAMHFPRVLCTSMAVGGCVAPLKLDSDNPFMIYLLLLLITIILSAILTPFAGQIGHHLGLVDRPGGRRQHSGAIPRTGGLALFTTFAIIMLSLLILPLIFPVLNRWLPTRNDPNEMRRLLGLLIGATFCAVAGYVDDRFDLSSLPQHAIQFIAALIAIGGLIFIKHVNNPIGTTFLGGDDGLPWWIFVPLTLFWFMGMMNTINWLDGLSGLVAGVTAILCAVLAIHMIFIVQPPQLSVALIPVVLLGVTVGFLPFNFAPARIFMGSSGSYFLGFTIAALGIIGGARLATIMLILGLPILDVAWLIVQRWRTGLSPAQDGRDHLHFRLLDLGFSERTIVLGYWGFCALWGILTLTIDDRLYKLIALIALGLLALGVLVWASRESTKSNGVGGA